MKNFVLLIVFAIFATSLIAQQTTRNLEWDGVNREYIEFVPSSYSEDSPIPVIFCLHGLGDDMQNFTSVGFNLLPGSWIVITPQALVASIPLIGEIGTAWNSGVGAELPLLGYTILNADVDDAGFLMAILDSLENNFNINTDSVFFMGFSMGGFMSHKMAVLHGDRIAGIAAVSGTLGVDVVENPVANINVLHIHGTSDATITYEDAGFNTGMGTYTVGLGAEQTVEYWRSFNNCGQEPTHTFFPNTIEDGLSFERFLYEYGDNDTRVALLKVNEGDHAWYNASQNDIGYTQEIYKFFTNTMDFPTSINIASQNTEIKIYPNPASNMIYINTNENLQINIFNITGMLVLKTNINAGKSSVNIESLPAGQYLIQAKGENNSFTRKISVQK